MILVMDNPFIITENRKLTQFRLINNDCVLFLKIVSLS